MRRLDEYLVSRKVNDKRLSPEIVDEWLVFSGANISVNTLSYYRAYCMKFAEYLRTLGFDAFIPEYIPSSDNYVPYIFSQDEVDRIFAAADNLELKNDKLSNAQFPLLLRILYGCGLRLGEALCLKVSDIDTDAGVFNILNSKGNRDKLVPMDDSLKTILSSYCKAFVVGESLDNYLFASNRKRCKAKPRSQSWAKDNFNIVLKRAGIDNTKIPGTGRGICLHCFRHTFAVSSFRKQDLAGIDSYSNAPSLSIYLGHEKLIGTQKYLHMTAESSEDIIEAASQYSKGLFPEVPR